jgi:hypothetical protein
VASRNDHAKIFQLQVAEQAWQESEADYFSRSLDCVAKLSQNGSFWKMFRPLLPVEEQKWSERLPRWGMIVAGALYPLRPLEPAIKEIGFFYLPTIGANEGRGSVRNRFPGSPTYRRSKMSEGLRTCESDPIYIHPSFAEVVMGYPIGWTELMPLEIPACLPRLKKLFKS